MKSTPAIISSITLFCLILTPTMLRASEIHDAVSAGDLDRVKSLLAQDPQIVSGPDESGRTPLHLAASNQLQEIMSLLIEAGADLNAVSARQATPLMAAISSNSLPPVEMLVNSGADISIGHPVFGNPAELAFFTESREGWSGTTAFLVDNGVEFDPNKTDLTRNPRIFTAGMFGHSETLEYLLSMSPDVDVVSPRNGRTPLIEATVRGHPGVVELLINAGADVSALDPNGRPAIFHAVDRSRGGIVKLLVEAYAPVTYFDTTTGRNLLHFAAIAGDAQSVDQLLIADMSASARDKRGLTPIELAAQYGNARCMKSLMRFGAKVPRSMPRNVGISPLLSDTTDPGEAVAWYLRQRGWAIKTANHLFVIDSEDSRAGQPTDPALANGVVTLKELKDQKLISLYTSYHGTGDDRENVHLLKDSLAGATYIHNEGDRWRGDEGITYLNPGDSVVADGVLIHTMAPVDQQQYPLLAYLIKTDSLTIFYNAFPTDDMERWKSGVAEFAARCESVDLAFMPIPEPGTEDDSDFHYLLQILKPKAVCLIDPNRREELFPALADKIKEWGFDVRVFGAENPGDHLVFSK